MCGIIGYVGGNAAADILLDGLKNLEYRGYDSAVDNENFSDINLIKENYNNLKNKLGRIPTLRDFDDYGEMDVIRIFDNNSLGSYYKFLVKYEKEYTIRLSEDER